jgi:multidrug efflux pump subunit AcrA (membrane-fusion protein)
MSDVVEISSGLKQGMKIITAGHQKLFPGAKVLPTSTEMTSSQQ